MSAERIQVTITADRLEAHSAVVSGPPAGLEELRAALSRAGVTFGIDEAACTGLAEHLADRHFEIADEPIASGVAPRLGTDGRLELRFEVGVQTGAARDDDSIDFKDRGLLKTVEQGEVIAVYTPAAAEGTEGRGVDGKGIEAAAGEDCLPTLGEGVSHDPGGELRAARAGVVQYQERSLLDVVDHHLHQGDVDLRSGHLDMNGSVTIQGAVTSELEARATADIDVKGMNHRWHAG